jgi:hypothetical protein
MMSYIPRGRVKGRLVLGGATGWISQVDVATGLEVGEALQLGAPGDGAITDIACNPTDGRVTVRFGSGRVTDGLRVGDGNGVFTAMEQSRSPAEIGRHSRDWGYLIKDRLLARVDQDGLGVSIWKLAETGGWKRLTTLSGTMAEAVVSLWYCPEAGWLALAGREKVSVLEFAINRVPVKLADLFANVAP